MSNSLLVYGAGALGLRVAMLWRKQFEFANISCVTQTERNHEKIRSIPASVFGFNNFQTRSVPTEQSRFSFVIVAIPPSEKPGVYLNEVQCAASFLADNGVLLLISSTGVYGDKRGHTINEKTAVDAASGRAKNLLDAESYTLQVGGRILRLAGLYSIDRGPHCVYLRNETSQRTPDKKINLIHYDDAARLAVRAMLYGKSGSVYLGCDGNPITRQEISDIAFEYRRKILGSNYDTAKHCRFLGTEESDNSSNSVCENRWTQASLNWNPEIVSFREFFKTE